MSKLAEILKETIEKLEKKCISVNALYQPGSSYFALKLNFEPENTYEILLIVCENYIVEIETMHYNNLWLLLTPKNLQI